VSASIPAQRTTRFRERDAALADHGRHRHECYYGRDGDRSDNTAQPPTSPATERVSGSRGSARGVRRERGA
jgi:hypothetical protein